MAGSGAGLNVLATTTTQYRGDPTTVISPDDGTATTSLVEARGQTTAVRQHHAWSAESAYDETGYRYTPRGELDEVTDPAGNSWTCRYDRLGRQIELRESSPTGTLRADWTYDTPSAVQRGAMDDTGLCSADPIHVAHADTARYG